LNVAGQSTPLGCAIDAYRATPYIPGVIGAARLTRHDECVLNRLLASTTAQKAFASLGLDEARAPFFIGDCIKAYRVANGEHKKSLDYWRGLPDPVEARDGLRVVAKFLDKEAALSTLSRDSDPVDEAIALLASQIRDTQHSRDLLRPTAPRNGGKAPSLASAIGWISESVRAGTKRAHSISGREIAEVVLELEAGEISEDTWKRAKGPRKLLDRLGTKKGRLHSKKSARKRSSHQARG
jgi:hypothetical protein